MKCPACKYKLLRSYIEPVVYYCDKCDFLYKFSERAESLVPFGRLMPRDRMSVKIPEIPEGTPIYVDNLQHKFHLEQGIVIKRDHEHYRVKLCDMDSTTTFVWLPRHWVKMLPEELISPQKKPE